MTPESSKVGELWNISVAADMPLFIDPFLLFNSDKKSYQALHEQILDYLRFLREKADHDLSSGLINNWWHFTIEGVDGV